MGGQKRQAARRLRAGTRNARSRAGTRSARLWVGSRRRREDLRAGTRSGRLRAESNADTQGAAQDSQAEAPKAAGCREAPARGPMPKQCGVGEPCGFGALRRSAQRSATRRQPRWVGHRDPAMGRGKILRGNRNAERRRAFARPKLENAKRQLGLYKGGPASCNRYKRDPGASHRGSLFDLAQGQPGADISAARGLKYRLI